MGRCCDLCGSVFFDQVLDLGVQPLAENDNGKRYPLALWRCEYCNLIQLSDTPPREEVFAKEHPYSSGNSRERVRHFGDLAVDMLARRVPWLADRRDLLWVDVGANDGTLLREVKKMAPSATVVGVEPTDQIRKAEGFPVYQEFFSEKVAGVVRQDNGQAQIITACNVLAHVPDVHDFMNGVTGLLADDGVFVTENHDWNSIARGLQVDTVYHEHLRYFTLASLTRLLDDHGLTVTDVARIPAHGGSFQVLAMKEPVDLEGRVYAVRDKLRRLLGGLKGPVYGVGATTRATPLIHYTGIYRWLHCVCEVPWSDKIGQYIPGTLLKVVDERRLVEDQPPYALLLSWHIKDDIIPKLRDMGYTGKFIVPLPVPEVVDA